MRSPCSIPFFAAAALTFLTLFAALLWLPESLPSHSPSAGRALISVNWKDLGRRIWPLLGLSVMSQLGLTLFETVFALYAQVKLGYGPAQVGIAFMVCGGCDGAFPGPRRRAALGARE